MTTSAQQSGCNAHFALFLVALSRVPDPLATSENYFECITLSFVASKVCRLYNSSWDIV